MSRSLRALAVTALLACTAGESGVPEHIDQVRDSAGVVILEGPVTQAVQLATADSPAVRIGMVEGDEHYQLYGVRGVRLAPDGSILVLNTGTHEIHRYSTGGEWLTSSGRRGAGPRELQIPLSLSPAVSDSFLVLDFGLRGFHIVDPKGRIVRSQAVRPSLSGFVGLLDSTAAVLAAPNVLRGIYDQIVTAEMPVTVVDLLNATADTLVTLSGYQQYNYTHGELVRTVQVPFTPTPAIGVRGGEIYVAAGGAPEIQVYAPDGRLIRVVRLLLQPVPLDQVEWEATIDALLESKAKVTHGEGRLAPSERERQKEAYRSMLKPEVKPFFDRMYLGDQNTVWVREYHTLGQTQKWLRIDSRGRLTTTMEVPARLLVRQITTDWVLGQEEDSMEVEYVVRYPTRRIH